MTFIRASIKGLEIESPNASKAGEKLLVNCDAFGLGQQHHITAIAEVRNVTLHHDCYHTFLKFVKITDKDSAFLKELTQPK